MFYKPVTFSKGCLVLNQSVLLLLLYLVSWDGVVFLCWTQFDQCSWIGGGGGRRRKAGQSTMTYAYSKLLCFHN